MLIDQIDQSHNVTSYTTEKALEQLKELCRNAVIIVSSGTDYELKLWCSAGEGSISSGSSSSDKSKCQRTEEVIK